MTSCPSLSGTNAFSGIPAVKLDKSQANKDEVASLALLRRWRKLSSPVKLLETPLPYYRPYF